ncbi:hypothetical protein EYF80_005746 [Liparis tanakae]|uniref:Uncharacterized protein n=1 Tax=Liparis tanakae TaxID=230148 RepID=A0A4Z2J0M2_9TELE|nr:hypothetical protein EYF80_005746 [Liparis tanakae]
MYTDGIERPNQRVPQHSSTTVPAEEEYSFFLTSRKPGLSLSTCRKVGAKQAPMNMSRRLGQAVPSCLNTRVSSKVGTTLASYMMRSSRLQPLSSSRSTYRTQPRRPQGSHAASRRTSRAILRVSFSGTSTEEQWSVVFLARDRQFSNILASC